MQALTPGRTSKAPDPDGIWPALCEAVLCLNVEWPRDNVVQLPLAASVGWDKRTDKLGHEIEKRSEGGGLLAPAVGPEPTSGRETLRRLSWRYSRR